MENYFNYFTEIEEHFQRRRGTLLMLSPLDWALMETWKDAGIPLEAVLRGIDTTFDKWERRPSRTRKVNGLAFCSQEVLASAEEMKEAAVGAAPPEKEKRDSGLDQSAVAEYLTRNAGQLAQLQLPATAQSLAVETAATLRGLAESLAGNAPIDMEDLERRLTVSEEKLFAALLAATPDEDLYRVRSDADRDLASISPQDERAADRATAEAIHPQAAAGAVQGAAVKFVLHVADNPPKKLSSRAERRSCGVEGPVVPARLIHCKQTADPSTALRRCASSLRSG